MSVHNISNDLCSAFYVRFVDNKSAASSPLLFPFQPLFFPFLILSSHLLSSPFLSSPLVSSLLSISPPSLISFLLHFLLLSSHFLSSRFLSPQSLLPQLYSSALLRSSTHVIWTVKAAKQAGCPGRLGLHPGVRPSPRPFMHLQKKRALNLWQQGPGLFWDPT